MYSQLSKAMPLVLLLIVVATMVSDANGDGHALDNLQNDKTKNSVKQEPNEEPMTLPTNRQPCCDQNNTNCIYCTSDAEVCCMHEPNTFDIPNLMPFCCPYGQNSHCCGRGHCCHKGQVCCTGWKSEGICCSSCNDDGSCAPENRTEGIFGFVIGLLLMTIPMCLCFWCRVRTATTIDQGQNRGSEENSPLVRDNRRVSGLPNKYMSALKVMPLRDYKDTLASQEMNLEQSCSICLDNYLDEEEIKILPCDHFFHSNCIDQWLKRNRTCPLCKRNVKKMYKKKKKRTEQSNSSSSNENHTVEDTSNHGARAENDSVAISIADDALSEDEPRSG